MQDFATIHSSYGNLGPIDDLPIEAGGFPVHKLLNYQWVDPLSHEIPVLFLLYLHFFVNVNKNVHHKPSSHSGPFRYPHDLGNP
jgi:hypothetical protein